MKRKNYWCFHNNKNCDFRFNTIKYKVNMILYSEGKIHNIKKSELMYICIIFLIYYIFMYVYIKKVEI
jgi:hypothetical protein